MSVIRVPFLRQSHDIAVHGPVAEFIMCDTEAERPTDCAVGTLAFTKDTNKLWKWHTSTWNDTAGSGGGAPTGATYITQTAHADLSAEQALSTLATGIVKNTTGTGVLSIAAAGTDYAAATHDILTAHTGFPGGTTNFLREDGSFAALPGGSGASLTRISGASGAAGADLTFQRLTADSATITTTALSSSIMTTTGVGAGLWHFRYVGWYKATAATTTGIAFGINHTGAGTTVGASWHHVTTGGAAATGVGDDVSTTVGGQLVEGKAGFTLNAIIGSASAGVAVINSPIFFVLEGMVSVTNSGSLELKIASEVAGSGVLLIANTTLMLSKIA